MNWFRNFIVKLLKIIPARDKQITIKEPLSFQENVLKNKIWYRGDAVEIEQFFKSTAACDVEKTRFWASVSQGKVRKIHSGIVSMTVDRYKDIVTTDFDGVEFADAIEELQEIWEGIEEESNFTEILGEAVTGCLASGDGAFKISTDEDCKYPVIEFYDAEDVEYTRKHGRVTEIKFYTTYQKEKKEYRLEEIYARGSVSYKLYNDAGKEVDLKELPETQSLEAVTYPGDYIMAVPLKIFTSSRFKGRGKALFDAKTDVLDGLDEVISQWMDAIRLGRIKRYIPKDLIPRDEETGELMPANPFDNDFIAMEEGKGENDNSKIDISQPQILYEAYVNSYASFLDMVLQGVISPATLGIDLKKTDNAQAQREKEKITMHVRGKIIDALNVALPQLVSIVFKTYDNMRGKFPAEYKKINVKFGEYASPDFDSTIETVSKGKQGGIMSLEAAVDELYGDSKDEEWKEQEIARLKAEQGVQQMQEPAVNQTGMPLGDEEMQRSDGGGAAAKLNGAQIGSLMNMIAMVKSGQLTRSEAINIISATLGVSRDSAETFIEGGM